jgi:hypothetical protein
VPLLLFVEEQKFDRMEMWGTNVYKYLNPQDLKIELSLKEN